MAGALTANDANTTIRIAEDTRRDSNSMKVIAALTMIFLPLTSVATFFSAWAFFTLMAKRINYESHLAGGYILLLLYH